MPRVDGFVFDTETGDVMLYAGDTGSYWIRVKRLNGEDWPSTARLLMTVKAGDGTVAAQRLYRLDDQWDAGDGVILVEWHNDDTDDWVPGPYTVEMRVDVTPIWQGTPSSARCVDQLGPGEHAEMIEGATVRTIFKGNLTILSVDGRI